MNARIYTVTDKTTGQHLLVKAANAAQAVRHIASDRLGVAVATGIQIAELMAAGAAVVDATPSTSTLAPAANSSGDGDVELAQPQQLLTEADAAADLAGEPRPATESN